MIQCAVIAASSHPFLMAVPMHLTEEHAFGSGVLRGDSYEVMTAIHTRRGDDSQSPERREKEAGTQRVAWCITRPTRESIHTI